MARPTLAATAAAAVFSILAQCASGQTREAVATVRVDTTPGHALNEVEAIAECCLVRKSQTSLLVQFFGDVVLVHLAAMRAPRKTPSGPAG